MATQTEKTPRPTGPRYIEYDEIVDKGTHVTGIAHLDNPAGPGTFEFRVSGQRAEVERFGEEAVIQQLELRVLEGEGQEHLLEEGQVAALELRRAYWQEWLQARCEALRDLVDAAELDLLADPRELSVRMCLELLTLEKSSRLEDPVPDLTGQDRLCEIELTGLDEGVKGHLVLRIDPTVQQGQLDVYAPVNANVSQAWGSVTAISGDPDLYLYRNGALRDASVSSGATDAVSSSGGAGLWWLYVRGYTTAQYVLAGDWI
jgi:hypothetical protein